MNHRAIAASIFVQWRAETDGIPQHQRLIDLIEKALAFTERETLEHAANVAADHILECEGTTYRVDEIILALQSNHDFKKEDHGCSTGDCPHEKQSECDEVLASDFPEDQK